MHILDQIISNRTWLFLGDLLSKWTRFTTLCKGWRRSVPPAEYLFRRCWQRSLPGRWESRELLCLLPVCWDGVCWIALATKSIVTVHIIEYPLIIACFLFQVIEKPGLSREPMCRLDHEVTEVDVENLISRSVERLLEIDSPSLETIKMQVAFDSSYVEEEESLAFYYQRRHSRLKELQKAIVALRPKDSTDFDALTTIHRQVRNFAHPSLAMKI